MEYGEYLKSEQWQKVRSQRLKIDNYKCQRCGNGDNLQVHHITYDNIFNEDVHNDLITLCWGCHQIVEKEKKQIRAQIKEAENKEKEAERKKREDVRQKEYLNKKIRNIKFAESIAFFDITQGGKLNLCKYELIEMINSAYPEYSIGDDLISGIVRAYFSELHYVTVKKYKKMGLSIKRIGQKIGLKYDKVKKYYDDDGTRLKNIRDRISIMGDYYNPTQYIWTLLKEKAKEHEQIYAVLSLCKIQELNNDELIIKAKKGVVKGLIERIYRGRIEKIFYNATGLKRKIICMEVEEL